MHNGPVKHPIGVLCRLSPPSLQAVAALGAKLPIALLRCRQLNKQQPWLSSKRYLRYLPGHAVCTERSHPDSLPCYHAAGFLNAKHLMTDSFYAFQCATSLMAQLHVCKSCVTPSQISSIQLRQQRLQACSLAPST